MAVQSPSPLATITFKAGLAIFRPLAMGRARPCKVLAVLKSRYPEERLEQPI